MSTETNKKKADKSDKIALYIQRTLCYINSVINFMPVFILCIAYKYYKISSGYTERFFTYSGKIISG